MTLLESLRISKQAKIILSRGTLDLYTGITDPLKLRRIKKEDRLTKIKNLPAVYFLFKNKKLVYIGKASHLQDRLQDHIKGRICKPYTSKYDGRPRGPRLIYAKDFDTVSRIHLPIEDAEALEPVLIARYRPELNVVGVDKPNSQLSIYD